ncbi:hypothetical protein BCR37DRAFT_390600 [Protomyces lactucae-debilis]|uniref:WSC domain-containing protein n=1 Tax=Protomyces lactucae-debilis TaxID=2754530 RepID=A0A1Y2FSA5_PROLT|nr:uncharacterized protein BCR37DRAFT_390600 [Protomyces lactucae-debilis]ORY86868.1 hypothetical protein BCR37DRAFT_390600 [Protomyces lactucae-debilis]
MHECYCGTTVPSDKIADSACNAPCDGDATQTCGNGNALQVYNILSLPALSSTGIVLPTASPSAAVKSIPLVVANDANAPATFSGCYQDSVNARSLPVQVANVGSVEQCVAACAAQGFALAGVEYTNECFCGNAITAPQIAVTSCQKYTCNAAPSEYCGGDNALQVYRLSGAAAPSSAAVPTSAPTTGVKAIPLVVANGANAPATFSGCYQDSVNARSLPVQVANVGSVEQCVAACAAQGFALAGVEYTNECFCGNAITAPQIAVTSCQKYTCNAAPSEYCGGDNALQVYRLSGAAAPSSAAVPTSAPTTGVKAIPLVVANGANAPATFSGCYQDSVNARSLPVQVANVGSVEQCVAACAAQGFALAGVEYTNECFCGNAITAPQVAVSRCQQYTCSAAATEYCGGDDSLQVYRLSGAPTTAAPLLPRALLLSTSLPSLLSLPAVPPSGPVTSTTLVHALSALVSLM